ncbi:MAG: hypothetical protein Gyms2KO_06990 [Gymnodinialimonas sp.]
MRGEPQGGGVLRSGLAQVKPLDPGQGGEDDRKCQKRHDNDNPNRPARRCRAGTRKGKGGAITHIANYGRPLTSWPEGRLSGGGVYECEIFPARISACRIGKPGQRVHIHPTEPLRDRTRRHDWRIS